MGMVIESLSVVSEGGGWPSLFFFLLPNSRLEPRVFFGGTQIVPRVTGGMVLMFVGIPLIAAPAED